MKGMKFAFTAMACVFAAAALSGCGGGGGKGAVSNCTVSPISYGVTETVDDPDYYSTLVDNDRADHLGVVVCPYYSLTVGGVEVPVYSTRCAKNLHSFAYVDIEKTDAEKDFGVEVVLTTLEHSTVLTKKNPSVTVLPEKRGVAAEIDGGKITAYISSFGSFTFTFNKRSEQALTLYLAQKEELQVPDGWDTVEIEPAKHTMRETTYTKSNTVYIFKQGKHLVDCITIPSESWVYLEDGAYLEAYPDGEGAANPVFTSSGGKNVKLFGHGIVDFSPDRGGEAYDFVRKGTFNFNGIDNFTVKGLISINSNTWTMCFTNCENVYIEGIMLFGYRVYSDGIMLSDCRDSLVTKCFVRTGDDAMETKSTYGGEGTHNVTYRDNDCWTDKGIGYGVIWETNADVSGVYFKNCSVGFAQSNWHTRLGALAIQLGDHAYSVSDVHFEDIEIYRCESEAVINLGLSEKGKRIENIYFRNVHCALTAGYLFRMYEHDLSTQGARFGNIYLDNVSKNGVKLTAENRNDKSLNMTNYAIGYSGWSEEKIVHINTL